MLRETLQETVRHTPVVTRSPSTTKKQRPNSALINLVRDCKSITESCRTLSQVIQKRKDVLELLPSLQQVGSIHMYIYNIEYNLLCYQLGQEKSADLGNFSSIKALLLSTLEGISIARGERNIVTKQDIICDTYDALKAFCEDKTSEICLLRSWNMKHKNHTRAIESKVADLLN